MKILTFILKAERIEFNYRKFVTYMKCASLPEVYYLHEVSACCNPYHGIVLQRAWLRGLLPLPGLL